MFELTPFRGRIGGFGKYAGVRRPPHHDHFFYGVGKGHVMNLGNIGDFARYHISLIRSYRPAIK